jgi:hypothetical protein
MMKGGRPINTINQEQQRQTQLLKHYMQQHFTTTKMKQLAEIFTFSELRKLIGEMDIEFFALCYFPKYFDRKFGRFHQELFQELKYMLSDKGLINAFGLPREHGKSTINSFLFPLYATLYDKSQFTLIISATEQIALPFLDMIKDELENNQLLIEDFGIQKGNRWNNNEIWIKSSGGLDSCIMVRGIDGSLRGIHYKQHRPTLVLLDDLLKDDTAKSETKREAVKNTFTDVVLPIGTRDTNILICGTILNEEDLMADLLKGKIPGVRSIKKSAVIQFSDRDDLWSEWEQQYNNLQDEDRINTALSFFISYKDEMLEGTEILWSEYLDYYYLMCKKQAMGEKSFEGKDACDAKAVDEAVLQEAFVRVFNRIKENKDHFIQTLHDNIEKVLSKRTGATAIRDTEEKMEQLKSDLKALIQLKVRTQIDEEVYHEEQSRISQELDKLRQQRMELDKDQLGRDKYKQRVQEIIQVIHDKQGLLEKFVDDIFNALVEKIEILSPTHFVFILKSGMRVEEK